MGANIAITSVAAGDLHTEVLPPETQKAFFACVELDFLKSEWYLAGGTALALQVGHRSSEDLDFFTERATFEILDIERALMKRGNWATTQARAGTLWGIFQKAKISFIAYPFFRPSPAGIQCGNIRILVPDDIAAMKIIAVSQRGRKRDFVDLYWYGTVNKKSLSDTILRAIAQFPEKEHSMPHFLKSLVYFADAEDDPMPVLHFNADWKTVKEYFRREIPRIAEVLLKLKR